jgi:hypothetical protein
MRMGKAETEDLSWIAEGPVCQDWTAELSLDCVGKTLSIRKRQKIGGGGMAVLRGFAVNRG